MALGKSWNSSMLVPKANIPAAANKPQRHANTKLKEAKPLPAMTMVSETP
jgi:hypothetical protein